MFDFKYIKNSLHEKSNFFIAGTDEVGRGPLAGPVVAASVSLHFEKFEEQEIKLILKKWEKFGIKDSKKLTSKKRQKILSDFSLSKDPLKVNQIYTHTYSKNMSLKVLIKEISPQVIDEINILNASLKAMKDAVTGGCNFNNPGLVMIDGNKKFSTESALVELVSIIKGDSKSLLIGLASIIAKEYRDNLMAEYCEQNPGYGWSSNAGYGTAKHLEAISRLGVTDLHRKTFGGVKEFYGKRS